VIFAALGIAIFVAVAVIVLKATRLKLWNELVEERNEAVAIAPELVMQPRPGCLEAGQRRQTL